MHRRSSFPHQPVPPSSRAIAAQRHTRRWLAFAAAAMTCLGMATARAQTVPDDLELTTVAPNGSFAAPLAVRHAPDGSGRIFVVEKGGTIQRVLGNDIAEFLSISVATESERGLLGLAFHPEYDGVDERRFYVSFTSTASGNPQGIDEFQTAVGNPDSVDLGSRRTVIRVPDLAGNHNGGDIVFGPDGYLYWSMGDGGPQNDPHGFAQCLWKKPADNNPANCAPGGGTNYFLLGKILRIDPTTPTASATAEMCAATAGQPAGYSIPADNPFVGSSNTCNEIAHYGMRNPWRISFDRSNGDLFVSDVGQNNWEETTQIPAGVLGRNLGWRCFEGTVEFSDDAPCNVPPVNLVAPFQTYGHGGTPFRCSISGGYRYRGPITPLDGMYISADFCSGEIFFARYDGSNWTPAVGSVDVWDGSPLSAIAGFGEDEAGNLYVAGYDSGALQVFASASSTVLFADGFE